MTADEEHALYREDRAAWAKHVAPRWIDQLKKASDTHKRWMWSIASPELKAAIRRIASE